MRFSTDTPQGFTILELIIALFLGGLVTTAGYVFYTSQYQTKIEQERVAVMQQNLRSAMVLLSKDIRRAGYDPQEATAAGITLAKQDQFSLSYSIEGEDNGLDDDGDNAIDEKDEAQLVNAISYILEDGNSDGTTDLLRKIGTGSYVIAAENIDGLEFRYKLKSSSTSSTTKYDDILAVEVALLIKSPRKDRGFKNTKEYKGFFKTWGPYNDEFKRRLLKGTIQCRNLNLQGG